jgi:hypothetical protein
MPADVKRPEPLAVTHAAPVDLRNTAPVEVPRPPSDRWPPLSEAWAARLEARSARLEARARPAEALSPPDGSRSAPAESRSAPAESRSAPAESWPRPVEALSPPADARAAPAAPLRPAAPRAGVSASVTERDRESRREPKGGRWQTSRSGAAIHHRRPPALRPGPPSAHLLAVAAWATGIGILGLSGAARALVALATGTVPAWYEPAVAGVGTAAVAFTAAALATERWLRLPWLMLGLATVPALVNVYLSFGLP